MRAVCSLLSVTLTVFVAIQAFGQEGFGAKPGKITDIRSSEDFFCDLVVALDILGELPQGVEAVKFTPTTAKDNLGTDLIDPEEIPEFQELSMFNFRNDQLTVEATLKTPPRSATHLAELAGELAFFTPGADPDAVLTVKDFRARQKTAVKARVRRTALHRAMVRRGGEAGSGVRHAPLWSWCWLAACPANGSDSASAARFAS